MPFSFLAQAFLGLARHNRSALAAILRRRLHRTPCRLDTGVYVTNPRNFEAGEGTDLYHGTYVLNARGRLVLGKGSHLGAFCYVNAAEGEVRIGEHCAIGPGTRIIAYSNHYKAGRLVTQERVCADVVIGNNVFVGANVVILPGARIGDNVVVGAGSVVKGTLDADAIYAGAPARKVREGWHSGKDGGR